MLHKVCLGFSARGCTSWPNEHRALMQIQPELIARRIALPNAHFDRSELDVDTYSMEFWCLVASDIRWLLTYSEKDPCRDQTKAIATKAKGLVFVSNSNYIWRLGLPSWITSKVLEVAGMRAPGGWDWTVRTYNVIPYTAKAVHFARCGDIKGLQHLFTSRQASPFDRVDFNGYTLLHVSITSNTGIVLLYWKVLSMPTARIEKMYWSFSWLKGRTHPL